MLNKADGKPGKLLKLRQVHLIRNIALSMSYLRRNITQSYIRQETTLSHSVKMLSTSSSSMSSSSFSLEGIRIPVGQVAK